MEVIRDRLIERLAGERVTVVKAPSGFGKSTLINQFLDRLPDITTCYVSVRHLDKYPKHFMKRFVSEIRNELGDEYFVRSTALLQEDSFDAGAVTRTFVKEIAEIKDSFLIIIGGVDGLSVDSITFLKDLLRYSRDDIAFVFTTESDIDPELEFSPEWRFERVGAYDLKFTDTEIAAVFAGELSDTEIERISEYSGGWAIAVNLLRRVWDNKEQLDEVINNSLPVVETYLSEKLFGPLNFAMKDFLIKTSLLGFIEPGAIKAIFGKEGTRLLREAQSLQLFSAGDKPDYLVLLPLFAEYLRKRAVNEMAEDDISGFYADVAGAYRESGDAFYAVYYGVESGITETIDDIISELFDDVIVFGDEDFQILVDTASDNTTGKGIDLLRAITVYRKLDYERAKEIFRELWLSTKDDADVIFGVAVWHYAYIISALGETDGDFLKTINNWTEDNEASSFVLLGQVVDIDGRYYLDERLEISKRAVAIAEKGNNPNWLTALYCAATSLSYSKEMYAEATEFAEKSNTTSKRRPTALKHLVELFLDSDEPGKAAGYLKELELLERALPLRFRYLVNVSRGRLALHDLRLDDAYIYFERGYEQHAAIHGITSSVRISGDLLVTASLLNRNANGTIAEINLSGGVSDLFSRNNSAWRGLLLYEFLQGDISDIIEEMLPIAEGKELPYSTGFLYLLRALSNIRNGDFKSAEEDLDKLQTGVNEDLVTRVTKKTLLTDDLQLRLPGDLDVDEKLRVSVSFLGGLTLEHNGKILTERDWEQRRALSLFSFFLKHREGTFTTERLIANIWPESGEEKGKQSLKAALKHIRGFLGEFGLTKVINYSSKLYYLAGNVFGESDIELLDSVIEAAEIANNKVDKENALRYLKEAERMNRADFLPNLYDDWADRYLHYYRILRMDTLERICNLLADLGRREDFLSYSARLIVAAGNDEVTRSILEENAQKLGVDISYIYNR